MKKRIITIIIALVFAFGSFSGCAKVKENGGNTSPPVPEEPFKMSEDTQVDISRIAEMPDMAVNYEMYDWKKVTTDMINWVFNSTGTGKFQPVAWNSGGTNLNKYFGTTDATSFSVPSYLGDNRMGPEFENSGEGIAALAAVTSAALNGMDMTNFNGRNLVKESVDFWQVNTGENVVLNAHSTITGASFWYELFPTIQFYQLVSLYPQEEYLTEVIAKNAEAWNKAVIGCGGENANFDNYSSYRIATNKPVSNGVWVEPDGAAGLALIMYMSYTLLKDVAAYKTEAVKYLDSAKWCMNYLENLDRSPFYEILTFFAPYLAARMNAEIGTDYNVEKMINFVFDGDSTARVGWGVINEDYSGYGGHGLMGSLTDRGGYAFQMNTFDAFWTYIPMVKYDLRFADAIGKWALHAANSAKLFYPSALPAANQSGYAVAQQAGISSFMGYEGVKKTDKGKTPYAGGDPTDQPSWNVETDFGYGNYHVGFLGSIVKTTNVEQILQLDMNATDMFANSYQSYLYYNPYDVVKEIELDLKTATFDLFDAVAKEYISKNASGKVNIKIPVRGSVAAVLAPINSVKTISGNNVYLNGKFVSNINAAINIKNLKTLDIVKGQKELKLGFGAPKDYELTSLKIKLGNNVMHDGKPLESFMLDTTVPDNGFSVLSVEGSYKNGRKVVSKRTLRIMNTMPSGINFDGINMEKSVQEWTDFISSPVGGYDPNRANSILTYDKAAKSADFSVKADSPDVWSAVALNWVNIDLSRKPVLNVKYADGSKGALSIKFVFEGGNKWGHYVLSSGTPKGANSYDVMDALKRDAFYDNEYGYQKTSIIIMPTTKDSLIKITDLSVDYMARSPITSDLGDSYNVVFTTQHAAKFKPFSSDAVIDYKDGYTSVTSKTSAPAYAATHFMKVDLDSNPLVIPKFKSVDTRYTLAVKFKNDDKIWVLNNNANFEEHNDFEYDLMFYLTSIYPEFDKAGEQQMQILIGSKGENKSVIIDTLSAVYPSARDFGDVLTAGKIAKWEPYNGGGSVGLDPTDNKAVITETGANNYGGAISKTFSVDFSKNPYLKFYGVEFDGDYWQAQILIAGESNAKYFYSGTGKGDVKVDLVPGIKIFDAAFNNMSRVEIQIIILTVGEGSKVKLNSLETGYRPIDFTFGDKLKPEQIHTWTPDISTGQTQLVDGGVKLWENNSGIYGGIVSGEVQIDFDKTPMLDIDIKEFIGAGTMLVGKILLKGEANSAYILVHSVAGKVSINVKEILKTGGGLSSPLAPYSTLKGKQTMNLVLWQQNNIGEGAVVIKDIQTRYNEDGGTEPEAPFEFGKGDISADKIAKWTSDSGDAGGTATLAEGGVKIAKVGAVYGGVVSQAMAVDFDKDPTLALNVKNIETAGGLIVVKVLLEGQTNAAYVIIKGDTGAITANIKQAIAGIGANDALDAYKNLSGVKNIKLIVWCQSSTSVTIDKITTSYAK